MNKLSASSINDLARTSCASDNLYRELREFVLANEPNTPLPSERKLAMRHKVSIAPVRKRLNRLVEEGLVYKVHGRGNFVAEPDRNVPVTGRIILVDTWGDSVHSHYARRIRGMTVQARELGYDFQIVPCKKTFCFVDIEYVIEALQDDPNPAIIFPWLGTEYYEVLLLRLPLAQIVCITTECLLPTVSSVVIDYYAMGALAGQYLAKMNCQRIAVLKSSFKTDAGIRCGFSQFSRAPEIVGISDSMLGDAALTAREIIEMNPDGLAIFDDTVARRILNELERLSPDFAARLPVICAANKDDPILPARIPQIEVDGYLIGKNAIDTIYACQQGRLTPGVSIGIRPCFIPPCS